MAVWVICEWGLPLPGEALEAAAARIIGEGS